MSVHPELNLSRTYAQDERRDYLSLLERFPYRPTLYLGLGGTGAQSVEKVKQLFLRLVAPQAQKGQEGVAPEIDPLYAFLAFDTDRGGRPKGLRDGSQWVHLGVEDLAGFYKGIGSGKLFKNWVIQNFPAGSLMSGASGLRNLGRLALLANLSRVGAALRQARDQITAASPKVVNSRPAVFVFGSLSGGTGSGMLLDTTFLLRELFGGSADIMGIIGAFDGLPGLSDQDRRNMLVNTYCGLKELNVFMAQPSAVKDIAWNGKIEYPFEMAGRLERPFDECYLVSPKRQDSQKSLLSQAHSTSFMARLAFMMSAYAFKTDQTPDYAGVMVNHRYTLTGNARGAQLCYLIPGLGQVHFPIESTANLFALDAARRYIKYQCAGGAIEGSDDAAAFLKSRRLDYRSLRDRVSRDPSSETAAILGPSRYDEAIESLMGGSGRYDNREDILKYGRAVPHGRMQEITARLGTNIERAFEELWPLAVDEMASLLVRSDALYAGALDFVEDLREALLIERDLLAEEHKKTVESSYAALETQWQQIEGAVDDVVTDEGIIDRAKDSFKLPRAKALYITFLNEADTIILNKARNELSKSLLTKLIDALEKLIPRMKTIFGTNGSLDRAVDVLDKACRLRATDLGLQAEGRGAEVEDILSFNVMTQEWRRAYLAGAQHLRPEAVLQNLLNRGWHPRNLLDEVTDGKDIGTDLAQRVVDQVEPLTDKERQWGPLDILSQTAKYKSNSPEEIIAKLYFAFLQPQMPMAGMTTRLGIAPKRLLFCGGIDDELKKRLEESDQLQGAKLHVSDNMERNRLNFFLTTLPVALAGCDLVVNELEPEYLRWQRTVSDIRDPKQQAFDTAKYHCFPGSASWPMPTGFTQEIDQDLALFARGLAISDILTVSEIDLEKMLKISKNPQQPLYALFQVGKQQFWLWPFFEPNNPSSTIEGKVTRLGTNVVEAHRELTGNADLARQAQRWVRWFEDNWTALFTAPQLEKTKTEALESLQERKGRTRERDQVLLWDQIVQSVSEWEIG